MTPRQIAAVGVARLGLPVPMAKLVTIQAIAAALQCEETAEIFADALAEWIRTRELESQCLEALCPLLVSPIHPAVIARIRKAIGHPSLASDLLLSLATGDPVVLPSWTGCHSGPAPELLTIEAEEQALGAHQFIPPLFTHKLEALQNKSGYPFLRQWAFEFSVLCDRTGNKGDGHFDYFIGSERGNTGQFVANKGHLARSAYLRTLACAVEHWGMPEANAMRRAVDACPAEPIFLQLALQPPPPWAPVVHGRTSAESANPQALVCAVIQQMEAELQHRIMHCSLAVIDEPLCHAELDVFALVRKQDDYDPQQAIDFYLNLLGKATPNRDRLRAFVSPNLGHEGTETLHFVPIMLPLIGPGVGYLQSDILCRIPYMPVSTSNVPDLELVPEADGSVLRSEGYEVGKWYWWPWNWKPSHPPEWPTPMACCISLDSAVAQKIAEDLGGRLEHVWRLTVWQRDQHYGEWSSNSQVGFTRTLDIGN